MINKITLFFSFILLFSWSVKAQDKEITGVVHDEQNLPIPGVNIFISGTSVATVTDMDGNFTITIPSGVQNPELEFSFIGYAKKTVAVAEQTSLNVRMDPDIKTLEEVIVVGYGTQKKKDLTGAVSSANLEAFRKAPNVNIIQSLQGTVPGLNIGQVNSAGQNPSIQIRGNNTISGNGSVLIVLDGIPYSGTLASINPNDIESIEVLKDASSATVYGSQAGNGVLLITSKKGKKGKPKITYSWSYASQTPATKLRPLNRDEFLEKVRDLYYDEAFLAPDYTTPNPAFDITTRMDRFMLDENNNIRDNNFDWWDAGTNPGEIQKHEVSVSGGADNVNYLISAGLTDQAGFIINDNFKRKNIRVNLESKATDWLTVGVQSFAAFNDYSGAEPDLDALIRQAPFLVPYDENGNLIPAPTGTNIQNPFLTYDVENHSTQNDFFGNFYGIVNFPFLKGLTYRVNYGNNYRISENFGASKYDAGLTGAAYKNHTRYNDYTLDNIVNYKRNFGRHDIDVTLLYGAIERESTITESNSSDISSLIMGYNSLEQGINQFANSGAWREALNYQMARVNYKFKDRYLLTATVRRDGASVFAKNEKWAIFPSAALGWIVSEESFLKDNKTLNFLKVRANYGATGNTLGRYQSLPTFGRGRSYVYGDGGTPVFGQNATRLENPNLRWEKNIGLNFGLDFGLFNKRLSGTVEYYRNKTDDLVFSVPLPALVGIQSILTNVGEVQNKGLEIQLTSQNIKGEDFSWSTTANFSTNKNEIIALTGEDIDGDGREDDLTSAGLFIGQSTGAIFGYKYDGIYQIGDDIPSGYSPGTQRIVDVNGDGQITADDRVILGQTNPAYRVSLLNTVTYKGFTLNIFFNSIQGGKDGYLGNMLPTSVGGLRNDNSVRYNYFSDIDYWSPRNPNGEFPRSIVAPSISTPVYRDRSFIRLQDVSLSYNFNQKLVKQLGVSDVSLFVSGKNLATWTKWKGWDPETGQGLDENGRPVMKSYSVGVNITF
ncbi:SusC/RagA family TonB-linked outer membrane protein [Flavobacterium sp. Sd200]|uniref:SusC/RagA family TonB-linked outer membrane protein n=1 Tax=Flavobacterium sp. Sd200 TaxID=2692211 RepID=UPI001367C50C|nr:TonB-dependent receptor [Flavobacterium sp. Sd200]MXN90120.1 SusC/RagA family TonB-linked outer membrane protein [Flavobacterium sp. Sd200]